MAKGSTSHSGNAGNAGKGGSSRGPSSHTVTGGNWPSTTGNPSGGGRGNAPSKGGK